MKALLSPVVLLAVTLVAAGWMTSCGQAAKLAPSEVPNGDPVRGAALITDYGCGTCHSIPGIRGANGLVGPPLTQFGDRSYIGGQLVNTGPNLQRWILDPQEFAPGTAMPDLDVTPEDARDIAAYLFTLE